MPFYDNFSWEWWFWWLIWSFDPKLSSARAQKDGPRVSMMNPWYSNSNKEWMIGKFVFRSGCLLHFDHHVWREAEGRPHKWHRFHSYSQPDGYLQVDFSLMSHNMQDHEPLSAKEALSKDNRTKALQPEIDPIEKSKTLELVPRTRATPNNQESNRKIPLLQLQGGSIQIVLVMISQKCWPFRMDVKSVFLNGDLLEKMYAHQTSKICTWGSEWETRERERESNAHDW